MCCVMQWAAIYCILHCVYVVLLCIVALILCSASNAVQHKFDIMGHAMKKLEMPVAMQVTMALSLATALVHAA